MGAILDIGCGANKHDGALGVDCRKVPGVAVICDFEQGLPFREGSVAVVYLHHIVEHMHDLIAFMVELYRVCEPGAKLFVRTPGSRRPRRSSPMSMPPFGSYMGNRPTRPL